MKPLIVVGYGLVTLVAGFAVGVYHGWHRRARLDRWQLAQADAVIGQAIDDRQTAVDRAAFAEALNLRWSERFCAAA